MRLQFSAKRVLWDREIRHKRLNVGVEVLQVQICRHLVMPQHLNRLDERSNPLPLRCGRYWFSRINDAGSESADRRRAPWNRLDFGGVGHAGTDTVGLNVLNVA